MSNTMTIDFQVDNQILSRTDSQRIVEDSVNYLYAQFTFSEDWANTTKAIIVENKNVDLKYKVYLNDEDTCKIPNSIIDYDGFNIIVVGENESNFVTITTSILFVSVLKSNFVPVDEPDVKYIQSDTLDVTKDGDMTHIEIPNIYFTSVDFTNDILKFIGRNNLQLGSIEFDYGRIHNITIEIDNTTYKFTLNAYDKNNVLLFSREADFDIEGMLIESASYDSATQELVLIFKNGNVVRIPISDILTGIATEDWVLLQLQNYVQKESGKGLSTNDYTNADKGKLSGIESQAQVNVLEGVKVNNDDLQIVGKKVNIDLTPYAFGNQAVSRGTMVLDTTNYVLTLTLFDRNNNVLTTQSVDLPSEDAIVSGSYDSANKSIVFTKQSGATFSVSIASLIDGLQPIIDANNKLNADYVTDLNSTNKFVTAEEKAQIITNKNDITSLQNGKQDKLTDSSSIDLTNNVVSVKQSYIDSQFLTDSEMNDLIEEVYGSEYTL